MTLQCKIGKQVKFCKFWVVNSKVKNNPGPRRS